VSWIVRAMSRFVKVSKPLPGPVAKWMFANGMTPDQKRQVVAGLVADSGVIIQEPVDRSNMPDLPTTWIVTLRDHSLKPAMQREFINNLGNVDEVIEIDTCHNVMISEPDELARILTG
jgi:pimeloyl-ACP methyl ester carboxylesterase